MDQVKERIDRFQIKNDQEANWAFRKLADVKAQRQKLVNQKKLYDAQNQEWFDTNSHKLDADQQNFESLIEEYRQKQPDGKVNVPAGKTIVRHTKDYHRDDKELVGYLQQNHPEFIKPGIKWGDFKKHIQVQGNMAIDQNGEIVPGIKVTEKETVNYAPNKIGGD